MSQNVFADMELPKPDERLLKTEFVLAVRDFITDAHLTQAEVARQEGMTQPGVSRMLKGMTRDISVEKLLFTLKVS